MLFFIIVFLVYGLLNYWIGLRGWQYVGRFIPYLGKNIYWLFFSLLSLSYLVVRIVGDVLPASLTRVLSFTGAYWLGAMFYFVLVLIILEAVMLLHHVINFLPPWMSNHSSATLAVGLTVLFLVNAVVAYGWWNSNQPQVVSYDVKIPKQAGNLKELRVVVASDLHLGIIVDNRRLVKLVAMINELQPDLLLLPGDVIDEKPGPFVEQDMVSSFRQLTPKYGIYAVPGNHEYIGRKWEEAFSHLHEAGIRVLRDEHVKVADSFYLVGRDDRSVGRFKGNDRLALGELIDGIDRSLPIILMDHQPFQLEEAKDQDVDLQLSGHTHRGQMFPNHLITRMIYEVDGGYLNKGGLQVIVSSGFGTWGPLIRVGNKPEILDIIIRFAE